MVKRCILDTFFKVGLTGFSQVLNVGCERKNAAESFNLSNW